MLPAAEWFRILLGNQPKWEIQPWWRQRYKMDSLLQWACRVSAQSYGNWLISQKSKTHPQLGSWIHPNIWTTKMTNLQRRIALHCSMKLDSLGRAAAQAIQTLSIIKVNCGQSTITSLWNTKYKKQCKNCNVPGGTSASLSSVRGCISATALWKRKACGGLHCQVECNWIFRRLGLLKEKFIFSFWYGALEVS